LTGIQIERRSNIMSGIFGALGLADTDRSMVNTVGQRVVYDAVKTLLEKHQEELQRAYAVFVAEETADFKRRFILPGGGTLQERSELGRPAAVKATGKWDVAFPLRDYGAQIAGNDVAIAYMTMQELDRHLDTVFIQNTNTVRRELLKALLDNVAYTFKDPLNHVGDLTIQPLANGDTVVYPPVLGSEDEATDSHYLESGYLASAISDTNNPFASIRDELEEHFGANTGGENIVVFINHAQVAKTEALTDFDEVRDRFVIPGANVDQLTGLPATLPGRLIGRVSGCWVSEWRHVPANYMIGIYMEPVVPKPLIMRVDPADTGLGRGLQLVSKDEEFPLEASFYRNRFGLGAGNRLNGVVMELGNGGTYTVPTGYGH
jgi:hypothetical protein